MDEMRAMLDELMGSDRNLAPEERAKVKPRKRQYTDRDVCKYYLAGFCPYEEFRRTKNDVGDCPCVHDEAVKAEWDALDEREKDRAGYEADLLRWLERFLADLRKRKQSNAARLKTVGQTLLLHEDQTKLDAMSAQLKELLERAERLGEEGDVDAAMAAAAEADQLKTQRAAFEATAEARAGNNALKNMHQEVCPVSGLIINNDETRLRDHHQGRNYNAWKRLHETHERLVEELQARSLRLRGGREERGAADEAGARGREDDGVARRREEDERRRPRRDRSRDRSWERRRGSRERSPDRRRGSRERSPDRRRDGRDRRRYDEDRDSYRDSYRDSFRDSYRDSYRDRPRYGSYRDDDYDRRRRPSRASRTDYPEEGEL